MKDCSTSKNEWTISRKTTYHDKGFDWTWYPALGLFCTMQSLVKLCVRFYHAAPWVRLWRSHDCCKTSCNLFRRAFQQGDWRPARRALGVIRFRRGPCTPVGKLRSKFNATKHGIFSSVILLPGESNAELDALVGKMGCSSFRYYAPDRQAEIHSAGPEARNLSCRYVKGKRTT